MRKLHIAGLALMLMGARLFAQTSSLPQVFSPNAAELGKYGKIPVSYFNGLPNISIPLTELKAKDYTLPVYLTYHAGGNKPDQHPGWVGLGWTLHAGGCINRIVNGLKDEMTLWEYKDQTGFQPGRDPGYYHHPDFVQNNDWANQDMTSNVLDLAHQDYEPDEFLVCVDGLQFSFYIAGLDSVRIVSKTSEIAEVHLNYHEDPGRYECAPLPVYPFQENELLSLYGTRYPYFDEIEITRENGTKYVFGGSENAMEFSTQIIPQYELDPDFCWVNKNEWKAISSVNTWLLDRIEFPSGECIRFTYEKDGTPLVRHDFHHAEYFHIAPFPSLLPFNVIPDVDDDAHHPHYDTKGSIPTPYQNISFSILQPSYLIRISCELSEDYLDFATVRTSELKYPTTQEEFEIRAGDYSETYGDRDVRTFNDFLSMDYYKQLVSIHGRRDSISFAYNDDPGQRLHLESLRRWAGRESVNKYEFHYNTTSLPAYHSRQTDVYGYYNGRSYRNILRPDMTAFRIPDEEKMQAEMLVSIIYPTGGRTEFTYEAHRYAKEATQFPFGVVSNSSDSLAGGLRIKEIRDYVSEGNLAVRRTFSYQSGNRSSGILSGRPVNYLRGNHTTEFRWDPSTTSQYDGVYELFSEGPLRPLSETDGNHVTYSEVRETYDDGSNTVYRYANHDTADALDLPPFLLGENLQEHLLVNSFNSRELSRGLLLSREDRRQDGTMVRKEECSYLSDTTQYLFAVGYHAFVSDLIRTCSIYKLYNYFPYLRTKTITTYPDTGAPHVETFEYSYDDHRRLRETKRTVAGITDRETFTYTGDYDVQPYSAMKTRNMVSLPVEHLTFHKGSPSAGEKVIRAELTTWKQSGSTYYVPAATFSAAVGLGVPSFSPFTGTTRDPRYGSVPDISFSRYDPDGNLVESEDRGGLPTTYWWTQDGCHLAAVFTGARNGNRQKEVLTTSEESASADLNLLSWTSIDLGFDCERSGYVTVNLDFMKEWGRTVWWRMDYGQEHQWVWPDLDPEEDLDVQTLFRGILSAGHHVFQITASQGNYLDPEEEMDEEMLDIGNTTGRRFRTVTPSWGTIEVRYPVFSDQVVQVWADDCLFEDFEDHIGSPCPGFYSGRSYMGRKTLAFVPDPDLSYVIDWQELQPDGTWQYRMKMVPGTGTFEAGTEGRAMDHVRVFPLGTSVESFTWDSQGNLLSRTDGRGISESYTYDGLGRLSGVNDNHGNKVEGYEYNYKNR